MPKEKRMKVGGGLSQRAKKANAKKKPMKKKQAKKKMGY